MKFMTERLVVLEYDLFRLPEFLELDIYKIILNNYDEFLLHFRSNLGSFEKLMTMLKELYESSEDPRVKPGSEAYRFRNESSDR